MDVNWNPDGFSYNGALPGPTCGELVIDRYNNVEVINLNISHITSFYFQLKVASSQWLQHIRRQTVSLLHRDVNYIRLKDHLSSIRNGTEQWWNKYPGNVCI